MRIFPSFFLNEAVSCNPCLYGICVHLVGAINVVWSALIGAKFSEAQRFLTIRSEYESSAMLIILFMGPHTPWSWQDSAESWNSAFILWNCVIFLTEKLLWAA